MEQKFKINAKTISFVAIFSACSYVLYLLNFPLPFLFPSFLEINLSDLPALIAGFSMGPLAGGVVVAIKILLKLPFTSTACVGELADFLNGIAFVLPASFIYRKNKTIKGAIFATVIGGVCSVVGAVIINFSFLIKAYAHFFAGGDLDIIIGACKSVYPKINADNFYAYYIFLAVIPFNALRVIAVGIITFLVYKRISKVLNRIYFGKTCNGIITKTAQETINYGIEFAKTLKPNDIVLLKGDLGAGKTTFTKGVAQGLGVTDTITSPTYAYMNDYDGKLFHFDCYRLSSGEDAEALGLTDYFYAGGICLIEWSENIISVLPQNCKTVTITRVGKNKRRIEL